MGTKGKISFIVAFVLAVAACSSDGNDGATTEVPTADSSPTEPTDAPTPDTEPTPATEVTEPPELVPQPADSATIAAIETALAGAPEGCDPLDPRQCVLPFPSNLYTVEDATTATGIRVAIPTGGLPANVDGVSIDVTEWNRNDGFTPNASIVTQVEDLDAEASSLPSWTDLESALDDDATVVLVNDATGERVPLWAEPDVKADDQEDRLLVIHPAVSLERGTTYTVGLRGLVNTAGQPVEPSAAFKVYRDALTTDIDSIEARREDMEGSFASLDAAGVARDDLQLAWSFTTSSTEDITERLLRIRDTGLATLNDAAPAFEITSVNEAPENEAIGRFVEGTLTVPNFMTGDGSPGQSLYYGDDGLPAINPDTPTVQAAFACTISDATLAGTEPAHLVSYGHGLLGSHLEVDAGNIVDMTNEHNAVYCATKWAGFSEDDVPNAVASLQDLSNFPTFIDRQQQGVLNHLVLGRLMLAADGLAAHPAFQRADGTPLIDTSQLFYDGNSQGGIMGLMLAAVSTDFERAVLGVPGINYSMLLPRSVDFDDYEAIFVPAYPDALDRELMLSVIQMMWDRSEGGGYIRNLVDDPLPGTQAKTVLLHVAQGDHQVSEIAAMVAARTAGIPISRPVMADGRTNEVESAWGIETLEYPSDGSGVVMWDAGAALIPIEQVAPREGEDPHSAPRNDAEARRQKAAFLFDGELIDVCNAAACATAENVNE